MSAIDRRRFILSCVAASIAGCSRFVRGWPKGYVSLSYDDGLPSQLDIAAPQLERAGFRGTFFLTWENMKSRAAEWAALAKRGHELGNHTMSHPCDLQRESVEVFGRSEIGPMQRWLVRVEGSKRARDFAYPCDVTDLGRGGPNRQADTFASLLRKNGILRARTSEGPPNSLKWTEDAPYRLQALSLGYDASSLRQIQTYLRQAIEESRWAILVMHEIGTGKSVDGAVSPAAHRDLLKMIASLHIPCGTMDSAIRHARLPSD